MNNEKKQQTIVERQQRGRQILLEQLRKMPILQIALEHAGVGRSTYSRWRTDDEVFRKAADEAMTEGDARITDMAESHLFSLIHERYFPALRYRLSHYHPRYAERVEISGQITVKNEALTAEQEAVVREALRLVGQKPEDYETETDK